MCKWHIIWSIQVPRYIYIHSSVLLINVQTLIQIRMTWHDNVHTMVYVIRSVRLTSSRDRPHPQCCGTWQAEPILNCLLLHWGPGIVFFTQDFVLFEGEGRYGKLFQLKYPWGCLPSRKYISLYISRSRLALPAFVLPLPPTTLLKKIKFISQL